jgi:hypothetical protein
MALPQNKHIIERRVEPPEQSVWWTRLSLAQKFSASSLGKFGYELLFIRHEHGRSFAVLANGSGIAVITEDGDINTTPNIVLRSL